MFKEVRKRAFSNGVVYLLRDEDGYPIEVTDTFLPYYTKNCINEHTNELKSDELGDRTQRWMIGVSCMSGCPVGCKFCATGKLNRWRLLTADEIFSQVQFIVERNNVNPLDTKELKINYTRMGEPFFNIDAVKGAIKLIDEYLAGVKVHHYISTIGLRGSDFSWIRNNITLQLSLHSLDEDRRHKLIPINNLMTIEELGQVRTESNLKTTLNMTLVDIEDFDINLLKKYFDKDYFFIKLSPVNENEVSIKNSIGKGVVDGQNIL